MNNKTLQQKMEENRKRANKNPRRHLKSYISPEQPRGIRETRKKKEPTFPVRLTLKELNLLSITLSIASKEKSVADIAEEIVGVSRKVYEARTKLYEIKSRI